MIAHFPKLRFLIGVLSSVPLMIKLTAPARLLFVNSTLFNASLPNKSTLDVKQ